MFRPFKPAAWIKKEADRRIGFHLSASAHSISDANDQKGEVMAKGQRILHQMNLNQKEIAALMKGGVKPQEQNRLNTVLRAQSYWAREYEKATGKKVPGHAKPAEKKPQPVPKTKRSKIPPECDSPWTMSWQRYKHAPERYLPAADVVSVSGDVRIGPVMDNYQARAGMQLFEGNTIHVTDGSAVIKFRDGSTVTLGSWTLLVIYAQKATHNGLPPLCPMEEIEIDSAALQEGLDALRGDSKPQS